MSADRTTDGRCVISNRLAIRHRRDDGVGYAGGMTDPADILDRIERFNHEHGGGVVVEHRQHGYTLVLETTGAPVARLKPTGQDDHVRVQYWSHRGKWSDYAPLGSTILPLDEALPLIANEPTFWTWV
jgi:hypothetical protein